MAKYIAEFYEVKLDGSVDGALGSDSRLVLDGRLSLPNMKARAFAHAKSLKNIKKFHSFRILKNGSPLLINYNEVGEKAFNINLNYETSLYLKD